MQSFSENNYIHYHLYNYLRFGLNAPMTGKDENKNFIDPSEAFVEHKRQILDMLRAEGSRNKINTQTIENQLNTIFDLSHKTSLTPSEQQYLNNIQQAIIKYLEEKNMNLTTKAKESFIKTGNAATNAAGMSNLDPLNDLNIVKDMGKMKTSYGASDFKTLERNVQTFNRMYNQYAEHYSKMQFEPFNELTQIINKLNQEFQKLTKTANGKVLQVANQNFYTVYNQLINSWQKNKTLQVKGEIGELLVFITGTDAGRMAAQLGVEELLKAFKNAQGKSLVGQKVSSKGLINVSAYTDITDKNSSFKAGSYTKNIVLKNVQGSGVDVNIGLKNNKTQEKIDVRLSGPKFPHLGVSVKNYAKTQGNKTDIAIHSGRSLYQMVQLHSRFLGHFLNVMSSHPGRGGKNLSAARAQAIEAMKLTTALYSLRGGMLVVGDDGRLSTMKQADVFVINDSLTGRFEVASVGHIINNVARNLDDLYTLKPELKHKYYQNKWVGNKNQPDAGSSAQRISTILSQFHAHKIKASIKWGAIY